MCNIFCSILSLGNYNYSEQEQENIYSHSILFSASQQANDALSGSLNLNLNINRRANDSEEKAGGGHWWCLLLEIYSCHLRAG